MGQACNLLPSFEHQITHNELCRDLPGFFILRGVTLIGIASQDHPMDSRMKIWEKLSRDWKPPQLSDLYAEIHMEELPEHIDAILQGKIKGRIVLNLNR